MCLGACARVGVSVCLCALLFWCLCISVRKKVIVRSESEKLRQLDVVGVKYFVDNKHLEGERLTEVTKYQSGGEVLDLKH